MATTTGGTTYVTSTDLVANYPTASLALANRVDVVASGGPVLVKTGNYTITVADILGGNKFLYNSASSGTFTLPTSSLVDGMVVEVAQIGAAALTVSGGTIIGTAVTSSQYQALRFVYVASGTTWYAVAESAPAGLSIVSPTSIANSGGSASASGGAVTFTGVTSVSLNSIFTSTYDSYRLLINVTGASTGTSVNGRLRASGTDLSTAYYYSTPAGYIGSATIDNVTAANDSKFEITYASTKSTYGISDIIAPQLAQNTFFFTTGANASTGGNVRIGGGFVNNTSQYDGFTLVATSGNITGTIRVYGYKNS
jgi:hypothetical protein